MGEWIATIIGEVLFWIEDFRFWKKKRARRKFEKENNLPKKIMIHPAIKVLGLGLTIIFFLRIIGLSYFSDYGKKKTSRTIAEIEFILEKEKKEIGSYPEKLSAIIRKNPLRKNLMTDYWGNNFFYEQREKGLSYFLVSKGKGGILNTKDDIKKNKKSS